MFLIQENSEAAWHRQREAQLATAVTQSKKRKWSEVGAEGSSVGAALTAGITTERAKLETKARARKSEAVLPSEIDCQVQRDRIAAATARTKNDCANERRHIVSKLIENRPDGAHLCGQRVFIAASVPDQAKVKNAASQCKAEVCHEMLIADIIVVPAISSMSSEVRVVALMLGKRVCTQHLILNLGESGASIKFKAAVSTLRFIRVSDIFRLHHPAITSLVKKCAEVPGEQVEITSD